jgi:hypothetical protein
VKEALRILSLMKCVHLITSILEFTLTKITHAMAPARMIYLLIVVCRVSNTCFIIASVYIRNRIAPMRRLQWQVLRTPWSRNRWALSTHFLLFWLYFSGSWLKSENPLCICSSLYKSSAFPDLSRAFTIFLKTCSSRIAIVTHWWWSYCASTIFFYPCAVQVLRSP